MKKLLEPVLNQVPEDQMVDHPGADRHERSSARTGYRNGYRERQLPTRVGTLVLRVTQTRDGNGSTDLFRRDRRSEQALVLARMEMVVQGVSARRVAHITEDWSVSVPPAGCSGDPCQKGRERGSGGRIDCDRRFGRRTTGAPGTTGFGISGAGDCVGWTWGSPMTTRS